MHVAARWLLALVLPCATGCPIEVNVPVKPAASDDDDDDEDEGNEEARRVRCDADMPCAPDGGQPFCNENNFCVECISNDDCDAGESCEREEEDDWECEGRRR